MPAVQHRCQNLESREPSVGRSEAARRNWFRSLSSLLCLLMLWGTGSPAVRGEDEKPADPYKAAWSSLTDLLRRREYGSAIAVLESMADDSDLQYQSKLIESDKGAIVRLQSLEKLVREQASELKPGAELSVGEVGYAVVLYDKDAKEDWLILKSKATARESKKTIAALPSGTWLQLVEPKLSTLDNAPLTLGIFLAFDQSPDPKGARKFLNEAAAQGEDVTRWLARLDEAEAARQAPAKGKVDGDEPLLGHWRIVAGKEKAIILNTEFRADGTSLTHIPPETLVEIRKRKLPPPKSNPAKGTWVRNEGGGYRITNTNGATAEILVNGDRFVGRNAGGDPVVGLRQAKKK